MIPSQQVSSRGFVLRKLDNLFGACAQLMSSGGSITLRRPTSLQTVGYAISVMLPMFTLVAMLALIVMVMLDPSPLHALGAAVIVGNTKTDNDGKKPAAIREMESNLKALAKELELGQAEMIAGPIPPARGEELESKAQEMEALQKHLDQYNRVAGIIQKGREVQHVTLPSERSERKTVRTTPGHLFVASESFRQYRQQGKQGWSANVDIKTRLGRPVKLMGEEAIAFEAKAFDPATLSTLGTDAIVEVDRDRELVRYEEPEILTIRDVLNSVSTSSDSIRYVKHVSTQRAANVIPTRGGLKPYLHVVFEPTTVSVETIAVLSKVTEQDVDDAPRLVGYINGEMQLDVKVKEEQQLLWGLGTGGEIKGLFMEDIPEFNRSVVGDTVIDTIRKMRTDLRKKRVSPTFVMVDPVDWEEVELTKGTDKQYIWGLVTDLRGPRIWSLRVVESDAMTNQETDERRILLGDGVRGATIYDRHDVRLAIGYVDDDFARNLRTLRAEERLALAVKRVWAFEFAITQAPTS